MKKIAIKTFVSIFLILFFEEYDIFAQRRKPPVKAKAQRVFQPYDDGGNFDFTYQVGPLGRAEMSAKIRAFLWSHWVEKKRGRISATFYSIEGIPTRTLFIIGTDKDGKWIVTEKLIESSAWFWKKDTTTTSIYRDVDRVEIVTDAASPEIPKSIPFAAIRDPKSYHLRLKAADRTNDFIL